jgi:hypothetical protein
VADAVGAQPREPLEPIPVVDVDELPHVPFDIGVDAGVVAVRASAGKRDTSTAFLSAFVSRGAWETAITRAIAAVARQGQRNKPAGGHHE